MSGTIYKQLSREGRVLVEGTPAEIKNNAKVQEAYLGGVHGDVA